ncbi:MAG: PAS domain S-box protein [Acidobacteriota bacterium]
MLIDMRPVARVATDLAQRYAHAVAKDRIARLTAVLFVLATAVYLLPITGESSREWLSRRGSLYLFLPLCLIALQVGRDRLAEELERRWWNDLSIAYGCWLVVPVLYFTGNHLLPGLQPHVGLIADVLYAVFYLFLILAGERIPGRAYRWRAPTLERAVAWPAALAFVGGLLGYFALLPGIFTRDVYNEAVPSMYLYIALDLYLSLRFFHLAATTPSPRWRAIHATVALSFTGIMLSDLTESAGWWSGSPQWGQSQDVLFLLPYVFLVLAARIRHQRFPEPPERELSEIRHADALPTPSIRTVVFALSMPVLHFALYGLDLLDPTLEPARELLVTIAMIVLGMIAMLQHRVLQRRARELWAERVKIERALRQSEQDLRLILERKQAEAAVRASEEKFRKVFRASPDALVITTVKQGTILDVNDGFERVYGHHRDDVIGQTVADIHFWVRESDRDAFLRTFERRGNAVADVWVRRHSGEERRVRLSSQRLEFDGAPCLLTVSHDITETHRLHERLRDQANLLEQAHDAIWALDPEGHIVFWNRGAEQLYGWHADEATGRTASGLLGTEPVDHDWYGISKHRTRDGGEVIVRSRWTRVRDGGGKVRSYLVINTELSEITPGPMKSLQSL